MTSSPPQLGQVWSRGPSAQSTQKVHSKLQITAGPSTASGASHFSQVARISSTDATVVGVASAAWRSTTGSFPHRLVTRVERAAEPRLRARLVRTFLRSTGRQETARAVLPAVAIHRLEDRNVRPGEADALRALVARESGQPLPPP